MKRQVYKNKKTHNMFITAVWVYFLSNYDGQRTKVQYQVLISMIIPIMMTMIMMMMMMMMITDDDDVEVEEEEVRDEED